MNSSLDCEKKKLGRWPVSSLICRSHVKEPAVWPICSPPSSVGDRGHRGHRESLASQLSLIDPGATERPPQNEVDHSWGMAPPVVL